MAVLECVRGGLNVGGVVSLHGLLQTGEDPNPAANGAQRPTLKPCENNYNTDTVVVVENGAEDPLVPDESKQRFFEEMNEAGVDWVFHHYAGTPHGFALPPSLGRPGKLHESTDRRSNDEHAESVSRSLPGRETKRHQPQCFWHGHSLIKTRGRLNAMAQNMFVTSVYAEL